MSTADSTRVVEARRRLRETSDNSSIDDDAVRIVSLNSPRGADEPLALHRSLAIIARLGDGPRQALASTVDAVRQRNPNMGLTGSIEIRGRRRSIDSLERPLYRPGADLLAPLPMLASAEAALFIEVAEAIDRAVLLANAELRGADTAAAELAQELEDITTAVLAESPNNQDPSAMLATIEQVRLPDSDVNQLRGLLAELESDPTRVTYQAAVEQAHAAKGGLLPGDGNQAMLLADLAIAEADGSLAAYDMAPGGVAERIHLVLEGVGLATHPAEAPGVARRALTETEQLDQMRAELLSSTRALNAGDRQRDALIDREETLRDDLRRVEDVRMRIQRRLRAQQQLLALARQTVDEIHRGSAREIRTIEDLSPLLIEDPLGDVASHLGGAVLSLLLRHSLQRQIICVSEFTALERWCGSVGERAGWVQAHGWFAAR